MLWLPPIESLQKHWQDVAGNEDVDHQCMQTHPLKYHSHTSLSLNINLQQKN